MSERKLVNEGVQNKGECAVCSSKLCHPKTTRFDTMRSIELDLKETTEDQSLDYSHIREEGFLWVSLLSHRNCRRALNPFPM